MRALSLAAPIVNGLLAIKLAVGNGDANPASRAREGGRRAALRKVLLTLIAAGLAGYALWRIVRALLGHGPEGADRGLDRVTALASASRTPSSVRSPSRSARLRPRRSGNAKSATAGVLGWPAGTWLVGIAGAVLIGVGLYQGYRGVRKDFLADSKTEEMSPAIHSWIEWVGTAGYLARMVVFGLVGVFLIRAAVDYNPDKAVGLDGALAKVDHASYGPFLLAIVAAGLIAFGVYSLTDGRYRRI